MRTHTSKNEASAKPANVQRKRQDASPLEVTQRIQPLEEKELLQGKFYPIQGQANNTVTSRWLPTKMQSASEGIVQRVTYAMTYEGETAESFAEVVEDATTISETQAGGKPLVKSLAELKLVKAGDKKVIHIVAHGNLAQVGDLDHTALVAHLKEAGINPDDHYEIILHSCDSGVVDPRTGPTQGTTLAGRVRTGMGGSAYLASTVTGMEGHAMTDSKGQTRVLKDPEQEGRYKELIGRAKKSQDKKKIEEIEDEFLKSAEDSQVVADGY